MQERGDLARENTALRTINTKVVQVLGNEHVSAQDRITGIIGAASVASGIGRGLDRDGFVKVCLDEPEPGPPAPEPLDAGWHEPGRRRHGSDYSIRRRAGCSAATAGRSLRNWVQRGVFDSYGEADTFTQRKRIFVSVTPDGPQAGPDATFLHALDRMAAWQATEGQPKRNGHGGARFRCPDHPTAAVVIKRFCGLELASAIEGTADQDGGGSNTGDGCAGEHQATAGGQVTHDQDDPLGTSSLGDQDGGGSSADQDESGVYRPPPTVWTWRGRPMTGPDAPNHADAAAGGDG
jgi:hypothetical protein